MTGVHGENTGGWVCRFDRASSLNLTSGTMREIIFVHDLCVDTVIGIYEWERRIKQTVSIDLEMAASIRKAAASDTIEDTLNYKAVAKRVVAFVEASRFRLVETLGDGITELLIKEFNVPWVRVTVKKPGAVRGSREVGVLIERGEAR
jgi:dihydroneopterin aldolase